VTLDETGKCSSAKIVYLNAGDGPVDAVEAAQMLVGENITDELINSAATHAGDNEINPYGNMHASIEFQRHLAKTLTKQTLKIAAERAKDTRP
jgi:carbon-monoxide dehydrogenase medium subunit